MYAYSTGLSVHWFCVPAEITETEAGTNAENHSGCREKE